MCHLKIYLQGETFRGFWRLRDILILRKIDNVLALTAIGTIIEEVKAMKMLITEADVLGGVKGPAGQKDQ